MTPPRLGLTGMSLGERPGQCVWGVSWASTFVSQFRPGVVCRVLGRATYCQSAGTSPSRRNAAAIRYVRSMSSGIIVSKNANPWIMASA